MHVAYVVLYVENQEACLNFWTNSFGMVVKSQRPAGEFSVIQIGFPTQEFNIELVPLALMQQHEHGLDLATPSMAFRVPDLVASHGELRDKGVTTSDINEQAGIPSFAFCDNEGRWFAVLGG